MPNSHTTWANFSSSLCHPPLWFSGKLSQNGKGAGPVRNVLPVLPVLHWQCVNTIFQCSCSWASLTAGSLLLLLSREGSEAMKLNDAVDTDFQKNCSCQLRGFFSDLDPGSALAPSPARKCPWPATRSPSTPIPAATEDALWIICPALKTCQLQNRESYLGAPWHVWSPGEAEGDSEWRILN